MLVIEQKPSSREESSRGEFGDLLYIYMPALQLTPFQISAGHREAYGALHRPG